MWFTYLRETTDPARATLARHAAPDRRPARKSRDSAALYPIGPQAKALLGCPLAPKNPKTPPCLFSTTYREIRLPPPMRGEKCVFLSILSLSLSLLSHHLEMVFGSGSDILKEFPQINAWAPTGYAAWGPMGQNRKTGNSAFLTSPHRRIARMPGSCVVLCVGHLGLRPYKG